MDSLKPQVTRTETIYSREGKTILHRSATLFTTRGRNVRQVKSLDDIGTEGKGDTYLVAVDHSHKRPLARVCNISSKRKLEVEEMRIRKARFIVAMYCFLIGRVPYIFILKQSKKHGIKLTKYDVIRDKEKYCCRKPKGYLSHASRVDISDGILFLGCNEETMALYNINTDTWTTIRLQEPVQAPLVTKHNNKVYIFEGDIVQIYDYIAGVVHLRHVQYKMEGLCAISGQHGIKILNNMETILYDPENNECTMVTQKSFAVRRVHSVHYHDNKYYALVTSQTDDVQVWSSEDGERWCTVERFHMSSTNDVPAVFVVYCDPCPVVPFIDYENRLRHRRYSRTNEYED